MTNKEGCHEGHNTGDNGLFPGHLLRHLKKVPSPVYALDVDGDTDIDVLSASYGDNKIAWYENLMIVNIANHFTTVIPNQVQLYQNYPNPFNPKTTIEFSLPHTEFVTLKIYNILGEELATLVSEKLAAGGYKYEWDASDMVSGVCFYKLEAGQSIQVRKMLLVR